MPVRALVAAGAAVRHQRELRARRPGPAAGRRTDRARRARRLPPRAARRRRSRGRSRRGATLDARMRPWTGGWLGVHTAGLGRGAPRTAAPARRARSTGSASASCGPGCRCDPTTWRTASTGARRRLAALGLEAGAPVFELAGLDAATAEAARQAVGHRRARRRIPPRPARPRAQRAPSSERCPSGAPWSSRSSSAAQAIRQLALDPLLPDALLPSDERARAARHHAPLRPRRARVLGALPAWLRGRAALRTLPPISGCPRPWEDDGDGTAPHRAWREALSRDDIARRCSRCATGRAGARSPSTGRWSPRRSRSSPGGRTRSPSLVALFVIGARQLGFAVLMHEAAHRTLFREPPPERLGRQLAVRLPGLERPRARTAPTTCSTTPRPGRRRIRTSRSANPFPITRASLRRKIWRDLSGQTGWKRFRATLRARSRSLARPRAAQLRRRSRGAARRRDHERASCSALLDARRPPGALPALGRRLAHHLQPGDAHPLDRRARDDPRSRRRRCATRAPRVARWWERLLIAPNCVNYHLEHHLLMTVPHYNLPRMHRMLRERGVLGDACVTRGYPGRPGAGRVASGLIRTPFRRHPFRRCGAAVLSGAPPGERQP